MLIRLTRTKNGVLTDATSCVLADPTGAFGVKRTDTNAIVVAVNTALTRVAAGIYEYSMTEPTSGLTYHYFIKYVADGATRFVERTASGSSSSTSQATIVDDVSAVLEDDSNAIFADADIIYNLHKAVTEVSPFVPYQSKEAVTLTAGMVDVGIPAGTLEVIKAEYPVGRHPPEYRNVTQFSSIVTIVTDLTPADGDLAYLFCEKRHTLDTNTSTLTPELEAIVVELAAAYCAINHVGDGRTAILNAITALDNAASVISNINTNAADSALGDMATQLGNIDSGITQGDDDLQAARDLITTATGDLDTALTDIGDQIIDALQDLTDGKALINTIPVWSTAVPDERSNAMAQLQTAQTKLAEARTYLSEGGLSNVMAAIGSREFSTAGVYASQASQSANLARTALQELNTMVNQAGTYMRAVTTGLNISTVVLGY